MPSAPTVKTVPAWPLWEYAVFAALAGIGVGITYVFGAWWFSMAHIPANFHGPLHVFDFLLFALLSYVVWYQIGNELLSWWAAFFMRHPVPMDPEEGMAVALVTAFVPGKEPYEILERTLIAMKAVKYPHDTWVLDEGDDRIVKNLCKRYGVYHFSRFGYAKYNTEEGKYKAKTKAGNYNAWFDKHGHAYEIVAQHDVDFIPNSDFLCKTLGYFRDPKVAFVGSPQIYGNTDESWIVKGAAEQAYSFYGNMQKGFMGHNMSLFIGANHVIRSKAHDDIGGYTGHIVEDHLTGMRLYANGWKSVYVPEILLVGEGPATWDAYFSQQMRWAYGLFDILFRHSPTVLPKMRINQAINYFLLQQFYFYGFVQAVGAALIALFFLFGFYAADMDAQTLLTLYPMLLIIQLITFLWLQRTYIDREKESGLHLRGKFLSMAAWPIYFLALVSAIRGKKLNYQVTPKGAAQKAMAPHLGTFSIHIGIGTLFALSIAASFITGRTAPQLMIWAILGTAFMYFFVLNAAWDRIRERVSESATFFARLLSLRIAPAFIGSTLAVTLFMWSTAMFVASFSDEQRVEVTNAYRSLMVNAYLSASSIKVPSFNGSN